jgi:4-hydroxyproline epimerase
MAVLNARGKLEVGAEWRQESITGSRFVGWLTRGPNDELIPHIRGAAYVTGEATLRFDPADPFRLGIGS